MNNKWMAFILVLLCFIITSGCTSPVSNNDTQTSSKESNTATESAEPNELQNMPTDYLDKVNEGWTLPTNADLQGTAWGWEDYKDDLGYRSKLVAFNEWTLDVVWNDGIDENANSYPEATYELTNENGVTVLEIDFREMAGKVYYYLLLSPTDDAIYTLEIPSDTNGNSKPESAVLSKKKTANYMELIGKWDRIKTMTEGDETETEPNTCIIEINGTSKDDMKLSYTDKVFPQNNYSNKKLIFSLGALPVYTNCGNDVWYADVNYVGKFDTTYAITLLEDGTLLLQNYFTVDGAPMVSYEWFRHVS